MAYISEQARAAAVSRPNTSGILFVTQHGFDAFNVLITKF